MNMITQSIAALSPEVGEFLTKALEDGCRYRWLRNRKGALKVTSGRDERSNYNWLSEENLDAKIDTEMSAYFKEQGIE